MNTKYIIITLALAVLLTAFQSSVFASSRIEHARQVATVPEQSERLKGASEQAKTILIQRFSSVTYPTLQTLQILPNSPFMTPTQGTFTSKFGWRDIGSGPEYHLGVDVANATGTSVVSSAPGRITFAGVMGGYGNVVMISHLINDVEYSTVYAHLSTFNVLPGQNVMQGQTIGLMGSTGRSTGPHLHFELHKGSWNGSRSNAIDPTEYIRF